MTDPNDILRKAIALQQAGDLVGAEKVFRDALDAGVNHKNMYIGLASIYDGQGRLTEACAALRQASAQHPDEPAVLSNLGGVLTKLGQAANALPFLEKAISLTPDFTAANQNLAIAYAELRDWRRALACAEIVLSADPNSIIMLQMVAFISVESGNFSRGLAAYDRLTKLKGLTYEKPNPDSAFEPTSSFSRSNPSPRYTELSDQYAQMHGPKESETDNTFAGVVTFLRVSPIIRRCFEGLGYRSMLDYGGGQGRQYELADLRDAEGSVHANMAKFLSVEKVSVYDAGRPGTESALGQRYDAVICTDVLEHIDHQDLSWVVRELFEHANKAVFATIATYPAVKLLPNGENAHCTLKPSSWWSNLFADAAKDFPALNYAYLVVNDKGFNNVEAFAGGPGKP